MRRSALLAEKKNAGVKGATTVGISTLRVMRHATNDDNGGGAHARLVVTDPLFYGTMLTEDDMQNILAAICAYPTSMLLFIILVSMTWPWMCLTRTEADSLRAKRLSSPPLVSA